KLSDYFEEANRICNSSKHLCNWMIVEFAGRLKDTGKNLIEHGIPPQNLAKFIQMIDEGKITGPIAKQIADEMIAFPTKDPSLFIKENPNYQVLDDREAIEKLVDQVLAANHQSVLDFRSGKERAFGFLVGQVMKLSQGKASPSIVNHILQQKLKL
ncbi:MAG: Asp-tRNA(Asn)/Glu-tRNA(Gln) amidotransferase GatCAB subunit B, partial [Chlamydiia bacterium]|nr:Asp-tRNA(Asn)/Glu-tRNA(Gln) amidotransferase GatCAB subunit B [Chlamydiia bacterium]